MWLIPNDERKMLEEVLSASVKLQCLYYALSFKNFPLWWMQVPSSQYVFFPILLLSAENLHSLCSERVIFLFSLRSISRNLELLQRIRAKACLDVSWHPIPASCNKWPKLHNTHILMNIHISPLSN